MSLHKIDERLKTLGLTEAQRNEIIEMVREFGISVLRRNMGLQSALTR